MVSKMIPAQKKGGVPVLITSSIHALGLTVCFLAWWLSPADFSIPAGSTPLVGAATKENILVAARINLFYKSIISGSLLWIVLTGLLQYLFKTYIISSSHHLAKETTAVCR